MESPGGSRTARIVGACLGAMFVLIALYLALSAPSALGTGEIIAIVLLGGLGIDAIVSAVRDRRSLISRIGPLP